MIVDCNYFAAQDTICMKVFSVKASLLKCAPCCCTRKKQKTKRSHCYSYRLFRDYFNKNTSAIDTEHLWPGDKIVSA